MATFHVNGEQVDFRGAPDTPLLWVIRDELGLTENTVVVYIHDNGPNGWRWNGGLRGRKGSTDEGGVRSPLLIRWPGMPAAKSLM